MTKSQLVKIAVTTWALALTLFAVQSAEARSDAPQAFPGQVQAVTDQLQERIQERKTQFGPQLGGPNKALIAEKCEEAQLKLGSISTKASETKRRQLANYSSIVQRLQALDTKLAEQDVEHEQLTTAIQQMMEHQKNIHQSLDAYTSALEDARHIDCAADPVGFYASVVSARVAHESLAQTHALFRITAKRISGEILTSLKDQVGLEDGASIVQNSQLNTRN